MSNMLNIGRLAALALICAIAFIGANSLDAQTIITDGVPVNDAITSGEQDSFQIAVPAGSSAISFELLNLNADLDLYVKKGSIPTTSSFDWRSWNGGNSIEHIFVGQPVADTYYILVDGWSTAASTYTLSVNYSAPVLVSGVAVDSNLGTNEEHQYSITYQLNVPEGTTHLNVSLSNLTADLDLYLKYGSAPTQSVYDHRSFNGGTTPEQVIESNLQAGTYYIMVDGWLTAASAYTLLAEFVVPEVVAIGVPETSTLVAGQQDYYQIAIPAGAPDATFTLTGLTEDLDLYVRRDTPPTSSAYDWYSYHSGTTDESINLTNPADGTYYIEIVGWGSAKGNYTLTASYTPPTLTDGVSVSAGAPKGTDHVYQIVVPANATSMSIQADFTTEDCVDVLVSKGSIPAWSPVAFDYAIGNASTSQELMALHLDTGRAVSMPHLEAGVWYILVHEFDGCPYTLTVDYSETANVDTELVNGVAHNDAIANADNGFHSNGSGSYVFDENDYYKITVPAGQSSLNLDLTGLSADLNMYVKLGGAPVIATADYTWSATNAGSGNESISIPTPAAGTYWIVIDGAVNVESAYGIAGTYSAGNQIPLAPTVLFVGSNNAQAGSQGNPVAGIGLTPRFSAIANHQNATVAMSEVAVQVAADSSFSTLLWDSAWLSVAATTDGNRTPDLVYAGITLSNYTSYFWRIKTRDTNTLESPWSSELASFTTVGIPVSPDTLFVGSSSAQSGTQGSPVADIDSSPVFSAVFQHQNSAETSTKIEVQVAGDPAFTNSIWASGWISISSVQPGNRSVDVTYAGSALAGLSTYHWRVRFEDVAGAVSPWPMETASFTVIGNSLSPTTLFVDSADAQAGTQGNPVNNMGLSPVFSALYRHQDVNIGTAKSRVEVAADSAFSNSIWLSSWVSISSILDGARSENIVYAGPVLTELTTYYWRVQFEDSNNVASPWSSELASFITAANNVPVAATTNISGLLQGNTHSFQITKTAGAAFSASSVLEFASAELTGSLISFVDANTINVEATVLPLAAAGAQAFEVKSGTTLIATGSVYVYYPIQRVATRLAGKAQESLQNPTLIGEGVSGNSGELFIDSTDVSLPGRRLPLSFQRSYRSFLDYEGPLGSSWVSAMDTSLTYDSGSDSITWLNSDGHVSVLSLKSGGSIGSGPYVENGSYIEWTRSDSGTPTDPLDDVFNALGTFGDTTTYFAGGVNTDGDSVFRVSIHSDRYGNQLYYSRDSLGNLTEIQGDLYDGANPTRHVLKLTYHDHYRLKSIEDYADFSQDAGTLGGTHVGARKWDFIYDQQGRLTQVVAPKTEQWSQDGSGSDSRVRTQYNYKLSTNLISEIYTPIQAQKEQSNNDGLPWLKNQFDSNSRVESQDKGAISDTEETHRYKYVYSSNSVSIVTPVAHRIELQIDAAGRTALRKVYTGFWSVDSQGVFTQTATKLRPTEDPDAFETGFEYNIHGEIIRAVLPNGNESQWYFDVGNLSWRAQGNLLRSASFAGTISTANLPSTQANGLLESYEYETNFNLPISNVDNRAFDLDSTFDITKALSTAGQLLRNEASKFAVTRTYDSFGNLVTESSPVIDASISPNSPNIGQQYTVTFTSNTHGQTTRIQDTSVYPATYTALTTDFEFGTAGFGKGYLTKTISDPGNTAFTTTFGYDSIGNIRTTTDHAGSVSTVVTNQLDQVVLSKSPSIQHLGGITYDTIISYDRDGNPTSTSTSDPEIGADGNIGSAVRSIVVSNTFDLLGRMLTETSETETGVFRTTTRSFGVAGQLEYATSPEGSKVVYEYDEKNLPFKTYFGLKSQDANVANALSIRTFSYDANSNVTKLVDGRGNSKLQEYDPFDRIYKRSDSRTPVPTVSTFTYTHGSNPSTQIVTGDDGAGSLVTLQQSKDYTDNAGRTYQRQLLAQDSTGTALGYGPSSTLTNFESGWKVNTYSFLPDGRMDKIFGDLLTGTDFGDSSPLVQTHFDTLGRMSIEVDIIGNLTQYDYSPAGFVSTIKTVEFDQSDSSSTEAFVYLTNDELGRVIERKSNTLDPIKQRWNAFDQLAWSDNPLSGLTQNTYDLSGRIVRVDRTASGPHYETTNPNGTGGTATTGPITRSQVISYDLDSNVTSTISSAGNVSSYSYDILGRVVQKRFPGGNKVTFGTSTALVAIAGTTAYVEPTAGFDTNGNIVSMIDEAGDTITKTYDSENRVLTMGLTKGAGSGTQGILGSTYEYDGLGRVVKTTGHQYGGEQFSRTQVWNTLSKVESFQITIGTGSPQSRTMQFDELGRDYNFTKGQTSISKEFDLRNRNASMTITTPSKVMKTSYAYKGVGSRTTAASKNNGKDLIVKYDNLNRVTERYYEPRDFGPDENKTRYLYDSNTGSYEASVETWRSVPSVPSGNHVQVSNGAPSGPNVFGSKVVLDGFGRIKSIGRDVVYRDDQTDPDVFYVHGISHGATTAHDPAGIAVKHKVQFGDDTLDTLHPSHNIGEVTYPHHTGAYGTADAPIGQTSGSQGIPKSSGDIPNELTPVNNLRIGGNAQNTYVYDFTGRRLSDMRDSDGTVLVRDAWDSLGFQYRHDVTEYEVRSVDFGSEEYSSVGLDRSNVDLTGGGLRFLSTEKDSADIAFPGDMHLENWSQVDGRTSYHDLLLENVTGSPYFGSLYFYDLDDLVHFKLDVSYSDVKLYEWDVTQGAYTLLASNTYFAASGPISMGVKIDLNAGDNHDIDFEIWAYGSKILDHTKTGMNRWAPSWVRWESNSTGSKLYRYKGYMDLDFSSNTFGTLELPNNNTSLNSLIGSGQPVSEEAPNESEEMFAAILLQENFLATAISKYRPYEGPRPSSVVASERALDLINNIGEGRKPFDYGGGIKQMAINIVGLRNSRYHILDQIAVAEKIIADSAMATQDLMETVRYHNESMELNATQSRFELESTLNPSNMSIYAPHIDIAPIKITDVGSNLSVPFAVRLPDPSQVNFVAFEAGSTTLPAGMQISVTRINPNRNDAWQGQLDWLVPAVAEGTDYRIVIQAEVKLDPNEPFELFCRSTTVIRVTDPLDGIPLIHIDDHLGFNYCHVESEYVNNYENAFYMYATDQTFSLSLDAYAPLDASVTMTAQNLPFGATLEFATGGGWYVDWSLPYDGLHTITFEASNSYGVESIDINIRIVTHSPSWNIRWQHTSVVYASGHYSALWGANYHRRGVIYHPHNGRGRLFHVMDFFLTNFTFSYVADTGLVNWPNPLSPPGPYFQIPELPGGIVHASSFQAWHDTLTRFIKDQIQMVKDDFNRLRDSAADDFVNVMQPYHDRQKSESQKSNWQRAVEGEGSNAGNLVRQGGEWIDGGSGLGLAVGKILGFFADIPTMPFKDPGGFEKIGNAWDTVNGFYDRHRGLGSNSFASGWNAGLNTLGEYVGVNSILSGLSGQNVMTGETLSRAESISHVLTGAFELGLSIAGGVKVSRGSKKMGSNTSTPNTRKTRGRRDAAPTKGTNCFIAGTLVLTQSDSGMQSETKIEDVKEGDKVWSRDTATVQRTVATGETGFKRVETTFKRQTDKLIHVSYRRSSRSKGSALRGAKRSASASSIDDPDPDGTIVGTEEHPFWSVSRGDWVPMEQLVIGERLMLADGSEATVSAREIEYAVAGRATMGTPLNEAGFFTVYNFRVADWHTYHVKSGTVDQPAVWVHNADCPIRTGAYSEISGTTASDFQAHHLNQNAAYGGVIPKSNGVSTPLKGNAFTEVGSPHWKAHRSMEQFWDQYRKKGAKHGARPTNLEYSKALADSLRKAGLSPENVRRGVRSAAKQRIDYGLLAGDRVPRVPGRLGQKR